nr:MAG TPA: hypothetical protein [Caudoviricetes sp.]
MAPRPCPCEGDTFQGSQVYITNIKDCLSWKAKN